MSYCRFSSDNFKSEVYAYEGDEGFVVSVAALRLKKMPPDPPDPSAPDYCKRRSAYFGKLERAKRVKIELPHAGATLACADLQTLKDTLLELRGIGYHVPDSALTAIESDLRSPLTEQGD